MGEKRNEYKILIGRTEGKRLHGRHRPRWKGNIRMNLGRKRCKILNWMNLAQDRD
jgi:hypothetical protein